MPASRSEVDFDAVLEQTRTYHASLDAETLADALQDLVATRRQSLWLICRYLADMAENGRCGDVGYDDVFDFAWQELAMRKRTVRERIRVGRALRELPAIQEAFVVGRLGFGRVREIVRVATPDTEAYWLQAALEEPMRRLEAMVAAAGGPRPTRHVARTEEIGDGLMEVRLVLPVDVWARLEAAMAAVSEAEGSGLTQAEALSVVADTARAHALVRPGPSEVSTDPNVGDADDLATPHSDDPIGSTRNPQARPRIRSSGAARDCAGGPTLQPSPDGDLEAEEAVPLSPAAQAMLQVIDERRKWAPDALGSAARIQSGAHIAIGLTELEMAGYLEKVSGGYRVVPARRRPLN
jgi:hypothetical protein